uniref:Alpha/beta hydrolases superfamily protein n=1 Tax=Tanacetum cinerariifolium TaxID=118510 RepID=A0A6L2MMT5_TANCI|nr:alpha/beta hydrolases superfamily protein [Tanacetum cinerariifolium]
MDRDNRILEGVGTITVEGFLNNNKIKSGASYGGSGAVRGNGNSKGMSSSGGSGAVRGNFHSKGVSSSGGSRGTLKSSSEERVDWLGNHEKKRSHSDKGMKKGKSDQKCFRRDDLNHLIGNYPKPPRDKDEKAFIGGSWSDSEDEAEDKTNDETCLMAQ